MGKVKIYCDLCDSLRNPDSVREIVCYDEDTVFLHKVLLIEPDKNETMHYICLDCLKKIGWTEEPEEKEGPVNTPNVNRPSSNTSENNISQE